MDFQSVRKSIINRRTSYDVTTAPDSRPMQEKDAEEVCNVLIRAFSNMQDAPRSRTVDKSTNKVFKSQERATTPVQDNARSRKNGRELNYASWGSRIKQTDDKRETAWKMVFGMM
jgi:hypothetical protein